MKPHACPGCSLTIFGNSVCCGSCSGGSVQQYARREPLSTHVATGLVLVVLAFLAYSAYAGSAERDDIERAQTRGFAPQYDGPRDAAVQPTPRKKGHR